MSFYEMLLAKKLDDDRDPKIEGITITENGTYSETGKAYSPVNVNVPLPSNAYLLKEVDGLPKDIATFSDGANLPMPNLKVSIEPIQSGSGDPSPSNVRPISGWTEANVTVADDVNNPTVTHTTTIPFLDSQGNPVEVFGGELDVISGTIGNEKTLAKIDLSTITTWNSDVPNPNTGMIRFLNAIDGKAKGVTDILCNTFKTKPSTGYDTDTYESVSGIASSNALYVVIDSNRLSGDLTTKQGRVTAFLNWLSDNPTYVIYKLETPSTFYTQPTSIKSQSGVNNVWGDCGQILEGEYFSKSES